MTKEVQGMLIQLEATTAQLRREMATADSVVGRTTKSIDGKLSKVDGAFDRLGMGAGKAAAAVRALGPALAGLVTIEALRRAQQLGEEFTLLEARIKRLSGGTAEAAVTYSRLAEVARQSGTSLGETVKLWESLTGTLQELGATDAQVVRLTDTLQKIGTIGGSSAQEVSGALRQLGQGLAGGVLRAEEFNSVIEGMPELAREIARGLGVPFGELRQLMLDGQLTAEKVLGAIQSRAFDVDAEFAKLPRTVSQASIALTNDFGRAISEIDKAIGGSVNLARFLDTLAKGVRFTAGDFTDLERLNQLIADRAKIQKSYEQAERRTLLSAKERAAYDNELKRLNTEILEIQDRRVQQMKEEGKAIQSSGLAAQNEQYDKYLSKLKESAALQGVNSEVAKVRYAIEKGDLGELTEAQQAALLKYAEEKDAKIAAQKAGISYTKGVEAQISAIDALIARYDPALKAQKDYDAGMALADAQYKANKISAEQYQKVVQGLYTELNKPIWAQHNKQADEAAERIKAVDDAVQGVLDRLDPATAAARKYAAEQEAIADAMRKHPEHAEKYRAALEKLRAEYDDNQRAASQWGQFTERALDSVDQSFADAWKNIDQGFSGFADSLKDAFKNLLAELAHMAITRPILMQFASALGVGGLAGQSSGLLGSLGGGGGSGGLDLGKLLNYGQSAYSAFTGVGPAVMAGYQSGGIGGAINGGVGYYGDIINGVTTGISSYFGGAAYSAATSAAIQTGLTQGAAQFGSQFAMNAGAAVTFPGAAGAAGSTAASGAGAGSGLAGAASAWPLAVIMGMIQSGKLYDAGVRPDASAAWAQGDGSVASKAFNVAPTFQAKQFEFIDGILEPIVGGKLAAIISGSTFSQALWGGLSKALFGGGWETKNYGYELGASGGDLTARQFQDQKKKGGLFSSSKSRTKYSELDPETMAGFQDVYASTEDGVAELFAGLGLMVEESSLDGLTIARQKIKTKGKTEEEIQTAIMEWFGTAAEAMNTELNKVFGTGMEYDLAGMQAFVGNLQGVNEVIRYLNLDMFEASVAGGKLAESLSAAAGGLEALATNSQTYYAAFFSESEKVADSIDAIKRAFADADIELAGTREAYRAMVEDIDLATSAGQEMFATLMALSGTASQYFDILDAQAQASLATAMGGVNASMGAVQRAANAERNAAAQAYQSRIASFNDMAATTTARIGELTNAGNALGGALQALNRTSVESVKVLRSAALATLDSALSLARAGKSLAGFEGLTEALDTIKGNNTDLYTSMEDFSRDQGRTANVIAELEAINGKQLSADEQLLKLIKEQGDEALRQYEDEMARIDKQLELAQAQLDALNGVDNSILALTAAMAALGSSIVAAMGKMPAGAGAANNAENNQTLLGTLYESILGRAPDAQGAAYWGNLLATGAIDYAQIAAQMEADARLNGELPAFARGGMHRGGLRLVGENGPELEVTGPARIYSNSQTAAMLGGSGGDTAAEVAELRNTLSGVMDGIRAIAKNTMKTASGIDRQNQIGIPEQGVTA